jgi:hypothetical protein
MIQTIGLLFAGYVVLRCLEIWAVEPGHWNTPRLGSFMKVWAGITCLGTIALSLSLFYSPNAIMGSAQTALHSPNTVEAGFGTAFLCMLGYGWTKSKRVRMKRVIARLNRQTVLNGIDLSRSLM